MSRKPRLSTCEWFDFLAALNYVKANRTRHELDALRLVRFVASPQASRLRGFFHGIQAERDPLLEERLHWGSVAEGTIMIYVRSHPRHNLAELAVTVHHEIDHALGLGETAVLTLAVGRRITTEDVEPYRVRMSGQQLVVPEAQPRPTGPLRPTMVFC